MYDFTTVTESCWACLWSEDMVDESVKSDYTSRLLCTIIYRYVAFLPSFLSLVLKCFTHQMFCTYAHTLFEFEVT
jgi:hypothetical protein